MFKRVLTVLILLIIVVAGVLVARFLSAGSNASGNRYRIATVATDTVKKTVTATGVLTAWTTVDIKSRAGGKVLLLPVDEGTRVRKGQTLAEIDPSDTLLTYNQAKADINANQAKVTETRNALDLQKQESQIGIATAQANLNATRAAANSALARYQEARSQADAQSDMTQADLANANATLSAEQARLHQMEKASHPQERATAVAALDQARANLANSEAQLKRDKSLLSNGYVAQADVDVAQAAYEVAKANLANAQAKVDTLSPELQEDLAAEKAKVRQSEAALKTAEANAVQIRLKKQAADAALADYRQAEAAVRQAEVKLRQAHAEQLNDVMKVTEIAQAQAAGARSQAALTNADVQLKDTHVTAPSDGIILKKYVEQGTMITSGMSFNSTGTSIVQLGDISRMYVDVQVDESDVAGVDLDQKVDVNFDAYPSMPFDGKVIKIEPAAVVDSNVTTVHVRVEVDNSAPSFRLLKPGMNATCEFIVDRKEGVVCVPNEALQTDQNGDRFVQIAVGGKQAPPEKDSEPDPNLFANVKPVKRVVQVGLEGDDNTEITGGLKAGERIVTQTIEPSTNTPTTGNPFGRQQGPGRR